MTVAGDRAQPTLVEVTALAGVSRATVSGVVNGSPRISPTVRALVQRAIAELGYVPNRAARSLVTRRADSIGLVMSEPEDRVFSEPFFARIVRGVSGALADTDTQLVLVVAHDPAEEARLERYITGGHVDGVLLASLHGDDPLPRKLENAGIPVVLVGRPATATRASYVDADNRGGATASSTCWPGAAGGSSPSAARSTWPPAGTGSTATWTRCGPPARVPTTATTWSRRETSARRAASGPCGWWASTTPPSPAGRSRRSPRWLSPWRRWAGRWPACWHGSAGRRPGSA